MSTHHTDHDTVFMKNIFTMVSAIRHTPEIERALQNAMKEKNVSKSHIIYCCLTGEYNLNRYLNNFDEEDIKWCYEQKLRLLHEKKEKDAAMEAMEGHKKVEEDYARKVAKA